MKKTLLLAGLVLTTVSLYAGETLIKEDAENGKADFHGKVEISNDAKNGKKAFLVKNSRSIASKKKFKINPDKYYIASVWVKAVGEKPSYAYLGIKPLDTKGKYIRSRDVNSLPKTFTELTAPCKAGDTVIKVKDGSKWKVHKYYVAAFDTKADKSDLPNRNLSDGIKSIEKKDGYYEITLLKPLKKAYPAGTKVREHRMGGYVYPKHGKVPAEWTKWQGRKMKGSSLRKGTDAQLILLCNYGRKGQSMLFDDLIIEEVDK
jgi:hypothetical protein